jgi:hypothetical protein
VNTEILHWIGDIEELRSKGITVRVCRTFGLEVYAFNIVKYRAAGNSGTLVLISHSQGANDVIEMARLLEREQISVDLLVTLAPLTRVPTLWL